MAQDDLHVIVYKILSYLYQQLKAGEPVDVRRISAENDEFLINKNYWMFILAELKEAGYTKGYSVVSNQAGQHRIDHLDRAGITMQGIEYLTDDRFMKKVREQETGITKI